MGKSGENSEEAPPFFIYIVVIARVIYSGLFTIGVLWVVTPFLGLPRNPIHIALNDTVLLLQWMASFIVVAFIVIGVLFKVWVVLSWMTAYVLSPSARREIDEFMKEEAHEE